MPRACPWVSTKITELALKNFSALKQFPKGSVLIAMYGATIGKVAIADFGGYCNQACCILSKSDHYKNKFVFYWFIVSKQNIISLSAGGGQPNISQDIIRTLKIPCPPNNEQQGIIDYLDHKTTQIDDLISKKERMIELIKEERTSVINHAVTKGLDLSVEMKDSGIEWIGNVPKHWEIKRLKFVVNINPQRPSGIKLDTMFVFIPMESMNTDGTFDNSEIRAFAELKNGFTYFAEEDVIFAKITPCFENGKGALLKNLGSPIGFGSTEFHVLRVVPGKTIPEFLFCLTLSAGFRKTGEAFMQGVAGQKRVTNEFVRDYPFAVPPEVEQKKIASFLNHKVTQIDSQIALEQKLIELLHEYRTALISEVVTGKIDVREEVA